MEQSTQTIHSFDEACKAKGLDPEAILPDVSAYPEPHRKALTAMAKLLIIIDAANNGWQPDWNDYDERKWIPWFDLEKTEENPEGFSLYYVGYYDTDSCVGSRLCFQSRELAQSVVSQNLYLYRDLMVL